MNPHESPQLCLYPTDADIEALCRRIIEEHPKQASAYRAGKSALGFLVGRVMVEVKGAANPTLVSETFRRLLEAT